MRGAAPILFRCARCSRTLVWARPAAATPAGAGPAASPAPASRSLLGGGGVPSAPGGAEGRSCGSFAGGGAGGGWGGRPPPPPRPVGRRPALRCPRRAPPGVYSCRGGCRAAAGVRRGPVGRRRVSAAGGGGGGGNLPALVRAPVFPGPASDKAAPFAPSWASPVRCRPAAGRACGRLPQPWCTRTPGAAASSGRVWGGRFFGPPPSALGPEWEGGGGSWGGPLVPWRRLLTARGGGAAWRSRPRGPAIGWGVAPFPLPPLPDPRAGPRWGPSSPRPSSRGAGRPGAAVGVSGQRLAGCGAAGSPPRWLSPPSIPREVARSPASCRTVGGAWVGGPSSPPHFLASAVWAVTCAAACVGAGAVAAAGCAGGSASGRGR